MSLKFVQTTNLQKLFSLFYYIELIILYYINYTGQEEKEAVRHMWGKLGMLLQRGNAQILANRVPSFPAPEIDGQQ